MLKNNCPHLFGVKLDENDTGSHALFAIPYVCNVSGRAMLQDSTVDGMLRKNCQSGVSPLTRKLF